MPAFPGEFGIARLPVQVGSGRVPLKPRLLSKTTETLVHKSIDLKPSLEENVIYIQPRSLSPSS